MNFLLAFLPLALVILMPFLPTLIAEASSVSSASAAAFSDALRASA